MRRSLALQVLALCALLWPAAAAADMPVPYVLSRPDGAGPFPAVVLLHDCSGLGPRSSGAPWRWASDLTRRGYVTLWPDSFTPRGRPDGICTDAPPPLVTLAQRTADAFAALAHLRTLPFVDAERIAVMGGSHGGSTTLAAIAQAPYAGTGFAAAIALYPNCASSFGGWTVTRGSEPGTATLAYAGALRPHAPLLILIGALDDWTPAEPCRRRARLDQDLSGRPPFLRQPRIEASHRRPHESERAVRARRDHGGQRGGLDRCGRRGEPLPRRASRAVATATPQ